METIKQTLARMRISYSIIKHNAVLCWYPLLNLLVQGGILAAAVANYFSLHRSFPSIDDRFLIPILLILTFLITQLFGIFLSGATFHSVNAALEGEKVSLGNSFSEVWKKRKVLSHWWLFSSGVFFLIYLLRMGLDHLLSLTGNWGAQLFGYLVGNIASLGWTFATYFAVPVLMTHPDKPITTLKTSAELFKKTWGEKVMSSFGYGFLVIALFSICGFATMLVNFTIYSINPQVNEMIFFIVYGIITGPTLALALLLESVSKSAFNASLYRYAENNDYVGPYSPEMLKNAFIVKQGNRKFFGIPY